MSFDINSPNHFFIGNKISKEDAQDLINEGRGQEVHESDLGFFYERISLSKQASQLQRDTAPAFRESLANVGSKVATYSSSKNDNSVSYAPNDPAPRLTIFQLPPERVLEDLANQLESATDDLKAKYNNTAVDAFEAAAGKVARAAEEVRENPGSEAAIEEFETATDELKNTAHALEGQIDDKQYQKIASAVDAFETATDHMLAADDGEADMANAIYKASDALGLLVDATAGVGNTPTGNDNAPSDPFTMLEKLSNELNSLISTLMDQFGINNDVAMPLEDATEQLEDAFDAFKKNPTDETSIEGLEKAMDALKKATDGLNGKVDENILTAVNSFEKTANKLLGLDGQQTKVSQVASEMAQRLEELNRAVSDSIDGDKYVVTEPVVTDPDFGPVVTKPADETKVPDSTMAMLKEILRRLDALESGGLPITGDIDPGFSREVDALDETTQEILDRLDSLESEGDLAESREVLYPAQTEGSTTDSTTGEPAVPAMLESKTIADLKEATNTLKSYSEDLGAIFNTSDLDAFVAATVALAEAGDNLSKDPSQANINAFLEKTAGLSAAAQGLEGKIDPNLYDNISALVDKFENGASLANALSADDDASDSKMVGQLIAVAVNNLDGLSSLVKDTVETKENEMKDTATSIPEDPKGILKPKTLADLEKATDNLKFSSEDLGAIFNTMDLDAFEAATKDLEKAGDDLLKDPSQANIDAFLAKSADLSSAALGLEGKIDPNLYDKVSALVDKFENGANLANALSSADGEGDPEMVGQLIAVAVHNVNGLSSLINEAVESKENESVA
jgi:hypothetical protein